MGAQQSAPVQPAVVPGQSKYERVPYPEVYKADQKGDPSGSSQHSNAPYAADPETAPLVSPLPGWGHLLGPYHAWPLSLRCFNCIHTAADETGARLHLVSRQCWSLQGYWVGLQAWRSTIGTLRIDLRRPT